MKRNNLKDSKEKQVQKPEKNKGKYFYAVGRRKSAVARVRLYDGSGSITVNKKDFKDYFTTYNARKMVHDPLRLLADKNKFDVIAKVFGGGVNSQADAVRLGISRAMLKFDIDFKKSLRSEGFLTRDPREKERKKYGLKRARKAPQFSKR